MYMEGNSYDMYIESTHELDPFHTEEDKEEDSQYDDAF